MRVKHIHDSSFVLQYIMHALEEYKTVNVKELSVIFEYDESTLYKLLKKIDLNFCMIDSRIKVKKMGGGIYNMVYSSGETEE